MHSLVCDENIGKSFVLFFRNVGYKVIWITETHPGITDEEVFEIACTESAILITADKDFARICFAGSLQKNQSINIILLREFFFSDEFSQRILDSLSRLEETQKRNFIVIDRNKIRIRTY